MDPALQNITLRVLKGWVKLEVEGGITRIMQSDDEALLPPGRFVRITVIKSEPASYSFVYSDIGKVLEMAKGKLKKQSFVFKWYRR